MNFYLRLMLFIFMFSLSIVLQSQINVEVIAPTSVDISEKYFQLKYKINSTEIERFTPPSFDGFKVVSNGPHSGAFSSVYRNTKTVNGKLVNNEVTTTYTFTLVPTIKGSFDIQPATFIVEGNKIISKSIKIKVEDNFQKNQPTNLNHSEISRNSNSNLFISAEVSNSSVYENQPTLVTYRYFVNQDIVLNNIYVKQKPNFSDVITMDVPMKYIDKKLVKVNGKSYYSGICSQFWVIPQKDGEIMLPGITFDCELLENDPTLNDFIDMFFNTGYMMRQERCAANSITLNVKELPGPQPKGFSGLIGNFTIKAHTDKTQQLSNEINTLKLVVEGKGNLNFMTPPTIDFPENFETYSPKVVEDIQVSENGIEGTITYEYAFIPTKAGDYSLSPISIDYFDPLSNEYKNLSIPLTALNVKQGKNILTSNHASSESLHLDIRPLKTDSSYNDFIQFRPLTYWTILCCIYILYLLLNFIIKKIQKKSSDTIHKRRTKAGKIAIRRMSKAGKLLNEKNESLFFAEIINSLNGYLIDKFAFETAKISKEYITSELEKRNIPNNIINLFNDVMNQSEFAQYSPHKITLSAKKELHENSIEVIEKIENHLKS